MKREINVSITSELVSSVIRRFPVHLTIIMNGLKVWC